MTPMTSSLLVPTPDETEFPIWFPGKDDDRIREHLGTDDLSPLYDPSVWEEESPLGEFEEDACSLGRFPPPEPGIGTSSASEEPFTFHGYSGKHAVKGAKYLEKGVKYWQLGSRFWDGPDGGRARFSHVKVNGKWEVHFDGNSAFRNENRTKAFVGFERKGWRIKVKKLSVNRWSYKANSDQAKKLHLQVKFFDMKGLLKGAKTDFKWELATMGAEAVWKVYEGLSTGTGLQPLKDYLGDPKRLWELAKAIVKGVITGMVVTAATTAIAGMTIVGGMTIIPIAAGLVISVGVGLLLDAVVPWDDMYDAVKGWFTSPPPPVPKPPVPPKPPVQGPPAIINTPMT